MRSKILLSLIAFSLLLTGVFAVTIPYTFPSTNITTQNNSQNIIFNYTCEEWFCPITYAWDINGANAVNLTLDGSLVGWWQFNNLSSLGESNTTIADLSKYGNNGSVRGCSNQTICNITYITDGKFQGAYQFRNASYVTIPNSASINATSGLTIYLWFKWDDDQIQTFPYLLRKSKAYSIYLANATKTAQFSYTNATSGSIDIQGSVSPVNDGMWHNIIISYNSSGQSLFYLDGILKQTVSARGSLNTSTSSLTLSNDFNSFWFYGNEDNLMIWNRSLSKEEIGLVFASYGSKYDIQNNSITINQTLNVTLNSTILSYDFNYNLFVSNSSNTINYEQKKITKIIPVSTITTNFSNTIKVMNPYFYGTTLLSGLTSEEKVSNNMNCSKIVQANYIQEQADYLSAFRNVRLTAGIYNSVNSSFVTTSWYDSGIPNKIKFGYDNNISTTITFLGIPSWLANTTTGWCSGTATCSPTDYDSWGKVVLSYFTNITNGGTNIPENTIVEVLNEPHGAWLNNLSNDNITKAREYVKLFNSTYYYIKTNYPNVKVIGLGGTDIAIDNSNIANAFFSNISQADGYSLHYYYNTLSGTQSADNLTAKINNYQSKCNSFSRDYCNKIYLNELNTYNLGSIAFTIYQNISHADMYIQMINNNITETALFLWATAYQNSSCDGFTNYSSYSSYNNQKLNLYYITYNFAHLFPGGSSIKQSSSNDDCIKIVSGIDGTKYNIALINTCTTSKNVSITQFPSITYGRVREYGQQVFYILDSSIDLGIMDSYEIKYLTTENCEQGIQGTNCLCSAGYTLNDDGLTCWTTTDLSNPSNPFFPSYQMMNGIAGAIILIIVATLSIAYFKFKRINVLQYVGGLSGILIGAWILSVLWNAIT